MENLTLEISNPDTVHALVATAAQQGTTPEDCALSLLESALLAQRPFVELVEPLAHSFDESRMSEEEFDALIEQERQALWEEQHGGK